MKIKETTTINTDSYAIWKIVKTPGNMPAWNPKCYTCDAHENIKIHEEFNATFAMSKNRTPENMKCKITELVPQQKIAIKYSTKKSGVITETIYLQTKGKKTKITHEIDFKDSNTPLVFQIIIYLISTLGHSTGQTTLDGIAAIV